MQWPGGGASGSVVNVNSDVVSWAFDDGASGAPYPGFINDANGTLFAFAFHTDASGNIIDWEDINVYVSSIYRWMDWCKRVGGSCSNSDSVVNRFSIYNNVASNLTPGMWSGPMGVPIPAAAWLFGTALGLLGWMRRRT